MIFTPANQRLVMLAVVATGLVVLIAVLLFQLGSGLAEAQEPPPNSPATGAPIITGTVVVGETLTADTSGIDDTDGLDNVSFSYQWIRSDGTTDWDIEGATGATYKVAAHLGQAIKVRVSFTDDAGNVESLTSPATAPVPIAEVTLTFSLEGTTVTCDSYNVHTVNRPYKECDDPSSTEQGESGEIEVELAIARSPSSQLFKFNFSIYQMEDSLGHDKGVKANDLCLGPELADSVSIETTPDDGTGSFTFTDEGTIFELCPAGTYQLYVPWYMYNYDNQEYEHAGTFRRYFFIDGNDEVDTSIEKVNFITPLYPDPPASHGDVLITGTQESGIINRELTPFSLSIDGLVPDSDPETTDYVVSLQVIGNDADSLRMFGRYGHDVPWCHVGNVGYSYLLKTVPEDGGWAMEAHVLGGCISHGWPEILRIELFNGSYEYIAGKDIALGALPNSAATGGPTISGTPTVGQTLTASASNITDTNGLDNAAYTYQWIRSDSATDTDISGATGTTYLVTIDDVGKAIKVRVTFTDDAGNEESLTSAATEAVAAKPNSPATGQPTISGTPQVGETLTADTSGIGDEDGLDNVTFGYQWVANDGTTDTDIQNQTGETYQLADQDVGKTIKVRVFFTDDADNEETLTSAATAAVAAAANTPVTGAPTISDPEAYVTVEIKDGDDTVSWSDPGNCSSDYNLYLAVTPTDNDAETARTHLGSAASGSDEATQAISHEIPVFPSGVSRVPIVEVELYCGEYEASSLVSSTRLAMGPFNLREGTYSSAPLTALTISSGTLSPSFDRGIHRYAAEVPSDTEAITLEPAVLTGFFTDFVKNPVWGIVSGCWGGPLRGTCIYGYGDGTTTGIILNDADEDTDGFQIDLGRGKNRLGIGVNTGNVDTGPGQLYYLTITVQNSPATGLPTISGTAQVDQTLTASTSGISDADGLNNVSYSYQWLAGGTDIDGANGSSYTLKSSEQGKTIQVRVTFTDDAENQESLTSEAAEGVSESHDRPYNLRATVAEGAITLTWQDPNTHPSHGLYHILRHLPELGEDKSLVYVEYTPSADRTFTDSAVEPGVLYVYAVKAVKDPFGYLGPASDPVEVRIPPGEGGEAPNSPATGVPTISGTAQVGETLTVDTSGISDPDGLENARFSYNWFARANSEISLALGAGIHPTYVVQSSSEGMNIHVSVAFTDDAGNPEYRRSEYTAAVTAAANPRVPEAPKYRRVDPSLSVSPQGSGELEVAWSMPGYPYGDGGSAITIRKVQWKEASGSWDNDADVSEEVVPGHCWVCRYTITGLTNGVAYTVRVFVTNAIGDSPPSDELISTPNDGMALTLSGISRANYPEDERLGVATYTVTGAQAAITWSLSGDDSEEFSISTGGDLRFKSLPSFENPTDADRDNQYRVTVQASDGTNTATLQVVVVVNSRGRPIINGNAQVGQTLTADTSGITDADGLYNPNLTYQWITNDGNTDSEIAGATASTYTLTDSEEGKTIKVRASFTDYPGNEESLTSAATEAVAAKPNSAATGVPTITGTAQVGETLTADTSGISDADGLDNATFSYQWVSNDGTTDTDIEDAANSTYTPVATDKGETIKVRVSFTDDGGNAETLTSEATAVVEAALTAEPQGVPDSHNGSGTFTFRILFSEPVNVGYATLKEHSFQVSNATIKRAQRVDGRNDLRKFTIQPSSDASAVLVLPATADCAAEGAICTNDGKRLYTGLEVTVPGPALANSVATGMPTITGTSEVGQILTASTSGISDADGLDNVSFSYQWVSSDGTTDTDIEDAASSTYTLDAEDEGKTIKVRVSFTDDANNEETLTSSATAEVAARPNRPATGLPTINGTVQVGDTLTADTTSIADADGLNNAVFNYQWVSNNGTIDADISGATESAYTLKDTDEGKAVKVRVTFTDDAGNEETLTSAATAEVVAKPNSTATGLPTISGTAQVGETLTADTSGIADEDGLDNAAFSYQWLSSRDTEIQGANASTYTLVSADEGKIIKVRVSFTDDANNHETLTSDATEAVAARPNSPPASTDGICGRTQEVQDAIVDKLTRVSDCAEVTDSHLAGITWRLTVRFTSSQAIKSDDFAGLSALTELQLISDQISALPEDVFGGLDSLEVLLISISELQELPDNVFDGLGSLRDLTVGERPFRVADEVVPVHQLSALPEDVFDGLDSLEELHLYGNQLAVLPEDVFDGLDSLELLNLVDNQLSALPEDVFDGLDSLEGLYLHVNNLSSLPEDVFDGLDSLETLTLNNNQLTTLPEDVFDGLGNLEGLGLSRNQITTLPEDLFDGLDSLDFLNFSNNQITTLPEDLFDGLGSLRTLLMEYNQISGLHSDVFGGLSRLYRLELGNNQVAELPDGIFDEIGGLAQLFLGPNPGAPFTFTAELEQQGDDAVVVGVAKGAPSDMSVSLSAEGGVLSTATVTVAAGSTESDPITVTPSGDGDVTVSVDSAEFVGEIYGLGHARTGLGDSLTLTIVTSESSNSNSPATGQPTISGTAQVDETITAHTSGIADADGMEKASFGYQWIAGDTDISGATGSSYTLKDADVGKIIKVRVSFTDDAGNAESLTSAATGEVEARPNSPATGQPTIGGTAQVGETLTADTSGITDEDGLDNAAFSYQWLADDTAISGATGDRYTLTDSETGKTVKVRVSFTDDADNDESLTSDATATVSAAPAANTPATGAPTISGTVRVGETLAASTSGISDADGLTGVSYTYQWVRNDGNSDSDIQGATGSTYTLGTADEGKTIKVRATFTDDANNEETLTSQATEAVAAPPPLTVSVTTAAPATHDGAAEFTFEIWFSEEPHADFSYRTLRDHAFTVTGGAVKKAQRLQTDPESNIPWRITVQPDGNGDVTVALPVTTDCGDQGAICTGDGRKLSNGLEFTVSGLGQ